MYGNVKEYLSGEINNDQIVLRGTGYFEAIASSNLSPHIFYGSITNYGNTITGKYYDTGGNENNWYATKLQRSSPLHSQE